MSIGIKVNISEEQYQQHGEVICATVNKSFTEMVSIARWNGSENLQDLGEKLIQAALAQRKENNKQPLEKESFTLLGKLNGYQSGKIPIGQLLQEYKRDIAKQSESVRKRLSSHCSTDVTQFLGKPDRYVKAFFEVAEVIAYAFEGGYLTLKEPTNAHFFVNKIRDVSDKLEVDLSKIISGQINQLKENLNLELMRLQDTLPSYKMLTKVQIWNRLLGGLSTEDALDSISDEHYEIFNEQVHNVYVTASELALFTFYINEGFIEEMVVIAIKLFGGKYLMVNYSTVENELEILHLSDSNSFVDKFQEVVDEFYSQIPLEYHTTPMNEKQRNILMNQLLL
ncbi:hypothetical protein [Lysinibacillus antri]|uniref:Uncharacterized protein n=1 Tax=Lysinibacillus antri TaxID=2498145 RepID=A0A3S0R636_9BACI|nr:hypothetical protein [Lysinibacillus antri]RUL51930.1 hypothetical protein EK386_11355 [Lysinibacillus antri]